MSKERQRARAVREAAATAEREKAAKARARAERRARLVPALPSLPAVPRRRRRYGALPVRILLALGTGWLAVQVLVAQLTPDLRARLGLALLSLAALPLVVVLTRSPR